MAHGLHQAADGQSRVRYLAVNPKYRLKLLALQSHIDQLIAEAEALTVDPNGDDETLLRVSKQLTELRSVLDEVERKLTSEDPLAEQRGNQQPQTGRSPW
jgi:hypothetical protein